MDKRTFAESCADSIINMLNTDCVLNADGSVLFAHRGHGGMWNSDDCDRDVDVEANGTITVILSTWIFPCEGEYDCPYLNRYAKDMADWIVDDVTGEELEHWDDVATRFFVKVDIDDEEYSVVLEIDNQIVVRSAFPYRQTFAYNSLDELTEERIGRIVDEVHSEMLTYDTL